ncbi:MAG: hypothetical protein JJT94_10605 [Bernardetiaceae bacterium]|nr:hypothetical protein [Bernardetiaceae bacterium]
MNHIYQNITVLCMAIILASLLSACANETIDPLPTRQGESFYPIVEGYEKTYQVNQTIYRLNEAPEQVSYQLREILTEPFISEGGIPSFKVERYTRPTGLDNFQLDSVWMLRRDDFGIVKIEHNVPFVKLRFPVRENQRWDGNIFNTRNPVNYQIHDYGVPKTIAGRSYPRTLTVMQETDSSLVSKNFAYEIFADSVGMVYKRSERLIYCQDIDDDCFGQKIIERGIISELILFDAGMRPE